MTFTVTIGSNSYEVYGGLSAAQIAIGGMIGDGAIAWAGLPATAAAGTLSQSAILVAVTNYLDAHGWQGLPTTPAVGGTTLQWPRTGVTDANGLAVDSATVPVSFVRGVFELSALVAADQDVLGADDAGTNIKAVKAGSAGVDYFVPTSATDGSAPVFPPAVQRLLGQYLAAAVDAVGGGIVTGNADDEDSGSHRWDRSWPF